MELYLRALQRYLQPNHEDRHRGVASADMGAALVGGHTATNPIAAMREQVNDTSNREGRDHDRPDVDRPNDGFLGSQRDKWQNRLGAFG